MNNKFILQAMALDLKRVAIGYHSGSIIMADRFLQEVITRKSQLDMSSLSHGLQKVLEKVDLLDSEQNHTKRAEDALTFSTIFLSLSK
jgi:hypothetical protein